MGQTLRNSTHIYSLKIKKEFAAGWGWGLCGEGGRGGGGKRRGSMDFRIGVYSCIMTGKKRKKPVLCLYLPVSISLPVSLSLSLSLSFWCASHPSSLSLSLSLSWFFSTSLCRVYRWYLYAQMQIQRHQCKYHWWHVGVSLPLVLQWETHNVHKCRYRDTNVISLYWCLCAI